MDDLGIFTKKIVHIEFNEGACLDKSIHGQYVGMVYIFYRMFGEPSVINGELDYSNVKFENTDLLMFPCEVENDSGNLKLIENFFIIKNVDNIKFINDYNYEYKGKWLELVHKNNLLTDERMKKILTDVTSELIADKLNGI